MHFTGEILPQDKWVYLLLLTLPHIVVTTPTMNVLLGMLGKQALQSIRYSI
jgi:hypothetical protein